MLFTLMRRAQDQPGLAQVRTSPARTSPKGLDQPSPEPTQLAGCAGQLCLPENGSNFLNLFNHGAPEFDAAGGETVEKVCKLSVGAQGFRRGKQVPG